MDDRANNILKNVRKKPWWFRFVPGLWGNYANTIYPWIYLTNREWEDVHSANPSPSTIATLLHESIHLERQKDLGFLKYGFKYLLSRSFRFEEELLAIMPQMRYLKQKGIMFDIEARARALSSSMYLWCSSYEEARRRLGEIVILD